MRVIVCGGREWKSEECYRKMITRLMQLPITAEIIHGACRGADRMAGKIAKKLKLPVREYPADWNRYPKSAGHLRNLQMLNEEKPHLVLAFHENIKESRGTADMMRQARRDGVKVELIE